MCAALSWQLQRLAECLRNALDFREPMTTVPLIMESLFFHPKLVHLPIALAVILPPLIAVILLAWQRGWYPKRVWFLVPALQLALVVSGNIAMQTGEVEEERVERIVPHAALEEHEDAATFFMGGATVVLVLALGAAFLRKEPVALALGLATVVGSVAVLAMGVRVGHLGGELVYKHGAAGAYVKMSGREPPVSQVHDD